MSDPRKILVIGGGPAGVFAAIEAKRTDAGAKVILLTDEACEPYEKPPLSKAVLLGKSLPEDALIAGPGGTKSHNVVIEMQARCKSIERAAREVVSESGKRFAYDTLVLATGSVVRELPMLPVGAPHVYYLRTEADARALAAALRGTRELIVVGAGLIGLEAAASAAELGIKVTVLEMAPRILARVCDEEMGAFVFDEHRKHGVDIRLGTSITRVQHANDRVVFETAGGETFSTGVVIVGTGVKPDDTLATAAGLATQDGIIVDLQCRTSDPNIFAAGDAVRFPGPHGSVRQENWRHAQDQGAVAGRNAAGASEAYRAVPSFWSEQYDLYIQGVGWPSPDQATRIHRPLPGKSRLVFETDNGVVTFAMGINVQRDLAAARRLIERRIPVDAAELADPASPLAAMLKAKT
jgi:3-phenylpropionate/trans-cinnamate dioxygenase ferredoxin reductase subunit